MTPFYGVDLENAKRTVERYITSGDQNPTVTATLGPEGSLFIRNLPGGVELYQKQDDGQTTNWLLIATAASVTAAIEAAFDMFRFKSSARLATTENIGLTGLSAIDGVTPVAGDRILVKDQTIGSENGIYIAAAGAWSRAEDFNEDAEVKAGTIVAIEEGATQDNELFILATNNPITVGVTALNFLSFGEAGAGFMSGWPVVGPINYAGSVKDTIEAAKQAAVTTSVSGGAGALQAAITAANDGDVLEITDSLSYTPVTIPAAKGLIIRSASGQTPTMTGAECIKLTNGARNLVIIGIEFYNTTSTEGNTRGGAITLEHQAIVENIIVSDCYFHDAISGPAIGLGYHQTIGGDNYTDTYLVSEMSDGIAVVQSRFYKANKSTTECAAISIRGFKNVLVRGCRIDAGKTDGRAILIDVSEGITVEDCSAIGSTGREAYKFDRIGTQTIVNTGVIRRCIADGADDGFDNDDMSEVRVENCIARSCTNGFISEKSTGSFWVKDSIAIGCTTGFKIASVVPLSKTEIINCAAPLCTTKYDVTNGYLVPMESREYGARFGLVDTFLDRTGINIYVDQNKEGHPDVTRNGSESAPFLTITEALARITDASSAKRYIIRIAAGQYNENLIWKDYVSAIGCGFECTRILGNFMHTNISPSGDNGRMIFQGIAFDGAGQILNHAASVNINIRFINCRLNNLIYNGPPNYGITTAGNLFLVGSTAVTITVNDAALHMYDGGSILSNLTINDGPDPTSMPFAELIGVYVQGAIVLAGRGSLYMHGCMCPATLTGTAVGGVNPLVEIDPSSAPFFGITHPVRFEYDNDRPVNINSSYPVVGTEGVILADASGGAIAVSVLPPAQFKGKRLTLKKVDTSGNAVTIPGTIEGVAVNLVAQYQFVTIYSDGANYYFV